MYHFYLLNCGVDLRLPNCSRILIACALPNTLLRQPWWLRRIHVILKRLTGGGTKTIRVKGLGMYDLKSCTYRRLPTPPKMVVKSLRFLMRGKLNAFIAGGKLPDHWLSGCTPLLVGCLESNIPAYQVDSHKPILYMGTPT